MGVGCHARSDVPPGSFSESTTSSEANLSAAPEAVAGSADSVAGVGLDGSPMAAALADSMAGASSTDADTLGAGAELIGTQSAAEDTLNYAAMHLAYDTTVDRLILHGQARMDYRSQHLEADSIWVDIDEGVLSAVGEPVLEDGRDRLIGESMVLDLDGERGRVSDGITALEDGIYRGDEMRRVGASYLDVDAGHFSTCRLDHPHYGFTSRRMRIEQDEKVVARPVFFEVADVPILALPYFVFSLRRGRHSGILAPSLESDSDSGRFFRDVGYYWAPNDHADLLAKTDLHRTGRVRAEVVGRYSDRYRMPASSFRLVQDHDPPSKRETTDVRVAHQQVLKGGTRIRFDSDARRRSTSTSLDQTWNGTLRADHTFDDVGAVSATVRSSRNFQTGRIVEELPTVSFRSQWVPFFPEGETTDDLWDSPEDSLSAFEGPAWYRAIGADYSMTVSNDRHINNGSAASHQAVDTRVNFSARSLRLFDALVISPRVTLQESWFSLQRDYSTDPAVGTLRNGWSARHTWTAMTAVSTALKGRYYPKLWRLRSMLHTVEPRLTFSYTPDFSGYRSGSLNRDVFAGLGTTGTPAERRSIAYALSNRLQLKWEDDEQGERRIDVLSVQASGSWDETRDTQYDMEGSQHFSDVNLSVRLRPDRDYGASFSMPYDPYLQERGTMTASFDYSTREEESSRGLESTQESESKSTVALSQREMLYLDDPYANPRSSPWNFSLRGTWSIPTELESRLRVNANLGWSPTDRWRVDYRTAYDVTERERESQFLTVRRDLHCWEGTFTWSESSGVWRYHVLFRVKALPDIKVEDREAGYTG